MDLTLGRGDIRWGTWHLGREFFTARLTLEIFLPKLHRLCVWDFCPSAA